ncbi:RND transporter [Methanolobus halotolerans]|uniref:RND transporter n=1 Tax=Methanolobus halotolerans TaxID=2052935 RepID=A0A4E0Q3Y2_9EURY|nr:RND transporter [Methanolobus halotolerans]
MPIIIIALLLMIISFQGASLIEMASGTDTFVDKDSKLYQDFDHLYLNLFSTESIVVMVEGGDVSQYEVLKAMDRLQQSTQNIPNVLEVTSASSVIKDANYRATGRSEIPRDAEVIDEIIGSSVPRVFIPDKTHAVVSVVFSGSASEAMQEDILRETERSVELAGFPADYTIIVTGNPAFNMAMNDEMMSSMSLLLMLSVILMIVILYLAFQHVRWRLLPLPIVLLGIIFTFGAMGYLNIPMTMVSMAAFPVLIGLGIDYAIQFHNRIEEELAKGESAEEAVVETIKHTGPAVLIALIITALGFFSLFTSSVPMIQDFGKLLMIGIVMCFLSSLFVGVTVIYSFHRLGKTNIIRKLRPGSAPRGNNSIDAEKDSGLLDRVIGKIATVSIHHPFIILTVASLLCVGGIYVDTMVPISTDTETFVPQDMPGLIDLQHMGDILGGSDELNIIIKTADNADPELLKWMDEFSRHEIEGRDHIYGSSSIVDVVKDMNGGTIPDNRADVEALYAEMPDTTRDRYMHGNSMTMLNLNIGNAMEQLGLEGIEALGNIVEEDIIWMAPPPGTSATITGGSMIFVAVISALTSGRTMMTLLGIMLVFFGLLVIYRDYLKALTPVITMIMVVGWSGGIMYYSGMEYTPMTATLGALILGIGSEYAVLMMERYFEEKDRGATPEEAMQEASVKIGKAIFTSGLTTVFGFSALIASPFVITSSFGIITVIDVVLALVATFVIFPAVIVFLDKNRENRKNKKRLKQRAGAFPIRSDERTQEVNVT